MKKSTLLWCFGLAVSVFIFLGEFAAALPYYSDYESNRDIFDAENDAINDINSADVHRVVPKSARNHDVRLRFGRRSDPNMQAFQAPTLRLRFGKRFAPEYSQAAQTFDQHVLANLLKNN